MFVCVRFPTLHWKVPFRVSIVLVLGLYGVCDFAFAISMDRPVAWAFTLLLGGLSLESALSAPAWMRAGLGASWSFCVSGCAGLTGIHASLSCATATQCSEECRWSRWTPSWATRLLGRDGPRIPSPKPAHPSARSQLNLESSSSGTAVSIGIPMRAGATRIGASSASGKAASSRSLSYQTEGTRSGGVGEWALLDSNQGPIGYEPTALTAELRAPMREQPARAANGITPPPRRWQGPLSRLVSACPSPPLSSWPVPPPAPAPRAPGPA